MLHMMLVYLSMGLSFRLILFLTNYTDHTFLERLKDNLRSCSKFCFSVSFIKKAELVLIIKDIESALQRRCEGKLITSTYENASNRNCLWLLAFLFVQNCRMRETIKFLFYINTLNSIIN